SCNHPTMEWFLTCTSDGAELTGAVGRSVTFQLKNVDRKTTAWSFHNDVIVTVKFGDPPEVTFFDDSYKPRLAFPKNGSALTISQLRMDDAGTYTAKTLGVKATFTLHVYSKCWNHGCIGDWSRSAFSSGYLCNLLEIQR
uniref:Immunoglobulin V-set domain-containing protein n=1 Tax=Accipiter nisus TaxID=211598 RepID=A0A8B9N7N6_9AVES